MQRRRSGGFAWGSLAGGELAGGSLGAQSVSLRVRRAGRTRLRAVEITAEDDAVGSRLVMRPRCGHLGMRVVEGVDGVARRAVDTGCRQSQGLEPKAGERATSSVERRGERRRERRRERRKERRREELLGRKREGVRSSQATWLGLVLDPLWSAFAIVRVRPDDARAMRAVRAPTTQIGARVVAKIVAAAIIDVAVVVVVDPVALVSQPISQSVSQSVSK